MTKIVKRRITLSNKLSKRERKRQSDGKICQTKSPGRDHFDVLFLIQPQFRFTLGFTRNKTE